MMNKSKNKKFPGLLLFALGLVVVGGSAVQTHAQARDPFDKPSWQKPKTPGTVTVPGKDGKPVEKAVKLAPAPVGIPAIQDRINYYKRIREEAAANGQPIPKPTSVLTLDEMSIMGIVRTPRGMAAMVEATPIKLTYTIYPGEKFFNGRLVAIEENRLVFQKVVKMSDGKFIASEENKALRQYSDQEVVQGTAPTEQSGKTETAKINEPAQQPSPSTQPVTPPAGQPVAPQKTTAIVSPVDEMNKAPETPKTAGKSDKKGKTTTSSAKGTKKPVKVAENKDH